MPETRSISIFDKSWDALTLHSKRVCWKGIFLFQGFHIIFKSHPQPYLLQQRTRTTVWLPSQQPGGWKHEKINWKLQDNLDGRCFRQRYAEFLFFRFLPTTKATRRCFIAFWNHLTAIHWKHFNAESCLNPSRGMIYHEKLFRSLRNL